MFYNGKQVQVSLNSNQILAQDFQLSQEANLSSPFLQGERVSNEYVSSSPVIGSLNLTWFLTGKDYLKDYIDASENYRFTGNIGGLIFNYGYLNSYSINITPNSNIIANANI